MATHEEVVCHDLGSEVLGLDVSVTIHRGVAFEDVVAQVVGVERSHPTHEDCGNNSVLQSIFCHSYVPHHIRLCINDWGCRERFPDPMAVMDVVASYEITRHNLVV